MLTALCIIATTKYILVFRRELVCSVSEHGSNVHWIVRGEQAKRLFRTLRDVNQHLKSLNLHHEIQNADGIYIHPDYDDGIGKVVYGNS